MSLIQKGIYVAQEDIEVYNDKKVTKTITKGTRLRCKDALHGVMSTIGDDTEFHLCGEHKIAPFNE